MVIGSSSPAFGLFDQEFQISKFLLKKCQSSGARLDLSRFFHLVPPSHIPEISREISNFRKYRLKKDAFFSPFFLEIRGFRDFNRVLSNKFAIFRKYRLYSHAKRYPLRPARHGKTQNRIFENPIFLNSEKFLTFFEQLRCKLFKTDPQLFGIGTLCPRGFFLLDFFSSCQGLSPHPDGIIRTKKANIGAPAQNWRS